MRRGVVLGMALSLHLVLLVLVLCLAGREPARLAGRRGAEESLRLRLLAQDRLPPVSLKVSATTAVKHIRRAMDQTAHRMPAPRVVKQAPSPTLMVARPPDLPATATDDHADGGFSERLLKAQQGSAAARQLPGSDRPLVSGIELVDRDMQGIGALARKAQRLFGIADRHCIDVNVWQHLTPRELSERHISPSEVDRVNDAYHCNRPPGLSF
jgi:hypothetical protein